MDATRPRPSILSLFDPLSTQSERPLSPDSDKENHGEISFFHPTKTSKVAHPPVYKLRRRLIDVGDMTVDEPDIRDLLADEVEELGEELNQQVANDDENATLTFKDMAKAATPKWSGRHASTVNTPKSPVTPRTPLADISFKEETTPMARKKPYKRQIAPVASKLAQTIEPSISKKDGLIEPSSTHPTTPEHLVQPSSPTIEISSDKEQLLTDCQGQLLAGASHLGSSVCTLDLPTSSDALLNDMPISVLISPSSPPQTTRETSPFLSPLEGTRLKPRSPINKSHRHSIDLQASFQLQLNADTTFDLLNDKISFFASKNGHDSFLKNLEEEASFDEEEFERVSSKSPPPLKELHITSEKRLSLVEDEKTDLLLERRADSLTGNVSGTTAPEKPPKLVDIESPPVRQPKSRTPTSPVFSYDEKPSNAISTPYCSNTALQQPPRPVPALKIVKRSRTLLSQQAGSASTAIAPSRRRSSIASAQLPLRRTTTDTSSETTSIITSKKRLEPPLENKTAQRVSTAPAFSNPLQSGDGPRRVLISEGPKLAPASRTVTHSEQGKSTGSGPRRIALIPPTNVTERTDVPAKPVVPASSGSGLRQPVKYATIGPSLASAIPKPIGRPAGSKLPAPSGNSKQRFGVSSRRIL
ncbi:unnamed protein product [Cyclocybe aegerita]|uniref:Uncharacterized protein n=1 Tax=Cyclocybe aegerita TaxID=1973307 RepID=A0A8S0X5R6_CYCAE|nr:unnamed protein product [Cyclocybe aegerita]